MPQDAETSITGKLPEWGAIILGAGVSGLITAQILLSRGATRILVLDEYLHLGGNHLDSHIGPYTFDLGSLIFFRNTPFFDYFPELVPNYLPVEISLGRLTPAGKISTYPVSIKEDVLKAGTLEIARLVLSFLKARLAGRKPRNAAEFASYWIGARFFRTSGLASYMERFYGVAPTQIEIDFAEKRMTWISGAAAIWPAIRRKFKRAPRAPKVQALVRPADGFYVVYAMARTLLEAKGATFHLGVHLEKIVRSDGVMSVHAGCQEFTTRRLVGTIPIRRLLALTSLADAPELRSVSLASLFFSFCGERGFPQCILYNFTHTGRWKRLTMYSDFYGKQDGREYFTVEVNMRSSHEEVQTLINDFVADTRTRGLFVGDLRSEGVRVTDNAYPIYTDGAISAAENAQARLADCGVEAFGRQGGFDYLQSTAAIATAVEAALSPRQ